MGCASCAVLDHCLWGYRSDLMILEFMVGIGDGLVLAFLRIAMTGL